MGELGFGDRLRGCSPTQHEVAVGDFVVVRQGNGDLVRCFDVIEKAVALDLVERRFEIDNARPAGVDRHTDGDVVSGTFAGLDRLGCDATGIGDLVGVLGETRPNLLDRGGVGKEPSAVDPPGAVCVQLAELFGAVAVFSFEAVPHGGLPRAAGWITFAPPRITGVFDRLGGCQQRIEFAGLE